MKGLDANQSSQVTVYVRQWFPVQFLRGYDPLSTFIVSVISYSVCSLVLLFEALKEWRKDREEIYLLWSSIFGVPSQVYCRGIRTCEKDSSKLVLQMPDLTTTVIRRWINQLIFVDSWSSERIVSYQSHICKSVPSIGLLNSTIVFFSSPNYGTKYISLSEMYIWTKI